MLAGLEGRKLFASEPPAIDPPRKVFGIEPHLHVSDKTGDCNRSFKAGRKE